MYVFLKKNCLLFLSPLKKQEYVIASKAIQFREVRFLWLMSFSSINNPVRSFGLKCYKQIDL
jgi:hypothetical protein